MARLLMALDKGVKGRVRLLLYLRHPLAQLSGGHTAGVCGVLAGPEAGVDGVDAILAANEPFEIVLDLQRTSHEPTRFASWDRTGP